MKYKKLTKEDIEALEQSVDKYKQASVATLPELIKVEFSTSGCPLCAIYLSSTCGDCPVALNSGRPGCQGTPYFDAKGVGLRWNLEELEDIIPGRSEREVKELHKKMRAQCRKEARYLQSLLDNNPGKK